MSDCPKPCKECDHYFMALVDVFCYDNKCGRLQTKICDPIYGGKIYPTNDFLNCESERGISKDILEHIFGERKDKCGKEGKYFARSP